MQIGGMVVAYGGWILVGTVALLAIFYLTRGRIRIEHGWGGHVIMRFTRTERLAHWLLAISFLVLAATGLNSLYGRDLLLPLLGAAAFAAASEMAQRVHTIAALAFMVGLGASFACWVANCIPRWADVAWTVRAGGLFGNQRPPAWKFNILQKLFFWLLVVGGTGLSLTGLALMHVLDAASLAQVLLPAGASGEPLGAARLVHAAIAIGLMAVVLVHIYVRTLGTQGAFDAMALGKVDINWAREHHSLWTEEELRDSKGPQAETHTPHVQART